MVQSPTSNTTTTQLGAGQLHDVAYVAATVVAWSGFAMRYYCYPPRFSFTGIQAAHPPADATPALYMATFNLAARIQLLAPRGVNVISRGLLG